MPCPILAKGKRGKHFSQHNNILFNNSQGKIGEKKISLVLSIKYETKDYMLKSLEAVFTQKIGHIFQAHN